MPAALFTSSADRAKFSKREDFWINVQDYLTQESIGQAQSGLRKAELQKTGTPNPVGPFTSPLRALVAAPSPLPPACQLQVTDWNTCFSIPVLNVQ